MYYNFIYSCICLTICCTFRPYLVHFDFKNHATYFLLCWTFPNMVIIWNFLFVYGKTKSICFFRLGQTCPLNNYFRCKTTAWWAKQKHFPMSHVWGDTAYLRLRHSVFPSPAAVLHRFFFKRTQLPRAAPSTSEFMFHKKKSIQNSVKPLRGFIRPATLFTQSIPCLICALWSVGQASNLDFLTFGQGDRVFL